jgi:hypothetical protein
MTAFLWGNLVWHMVVKVGNSENMAVHVARAFMLHHPMVEGRKGRWRVE